LNLFSSVEGLLFAHIPKGNVVCVRHVCGGLALGRKLKLWGIMKPRSLRNYGHQGYDNDKKSMVTCRPSFSNQSVRSVQFDWLSKATYL